MSLNDFEYGKMLGKGVFGSVCVVKRKEDKEIYAMKRVKIGGLTKKELENSFNEVRLLASLNNKNVIGYREAFYDQKSKTLNIVMEYADDGDLSTKIKNSIKKREYFSENTIWSTLIQILEGLKYLHKSNIIHRDLKSANIFLTKNGIVKIGDLNVSKIIGKNMAAITQTGTPYYAAPEIWNDQPYNYKCDIWSTGCIIYEMAALKLPFRGTSMSILYQNVMKGEFQPLSFRYSKDLQNIIKMILIINPKNRKTAEDLLNCDIIRKKMSEIGIGEEFNDRGEERALLMKTIKIPKNINLVNGQLPKKNYKKERQRNMMQMFENDEYETAKNSFYHPNNGEKKNFNYMMYNNIGINNINNSGKNINNYNKSIYNNNNINNMNFNNNLNSNVNNNINIMNVNNNKNNNINKSYISPLKYKPLIDKQCLDKLSNIANNDIVLPSNIYTNNLTTIQKNNNEYHQQNPNKFIRKIYNNNIINQVNDNNYQNLNNNRYIFNNKKITITDNSNMNSLLGNNISNNNYSKIKNNSQSRQKSINSKDSLHISTSNIYNYNNPNSNTNKNNLYNNITSFARNNSNKNKLNIQSDLSEIRRYEIQQMKNRNISTNVTSNNIPDINSINQRQKSKNFSSKFQQKSSVHKSKINYYMLNNLNNYENINNNNNRRSVKRNNLKKGRYNLNTNNNINVSNINTDNISNNKTRALSQLRGKQNLNAMDEYQMEYNKLVKQISYLSSLVEDKQKENKLLQRNKTDLMNEKLDERHNKNLLNLRNLNKIFKQNLDSKNINVKININNNYNNINNLNINRSNNANKNNNNINNPLVRNKSVINTNANNNNYYYEYGNALLDNNNKRINRPKSCLRIDDNKEKSNNRLVNDNNEKYSDIYKYYYQKYKENQIINTEKINNRKIVYEKINIINNQKGENRKYERCGEKIRYVGNGNFYNDYNRDIIKNSNLLKSNDQYSIHNFLNKDSRTHKNGPRIILPNKIMNL